MNRHEEIEKQLIKVGLTEAQARIYLLLIKHRELRIQEIVSLSKIPRSSVYENLKKLYELGIAEEITDSSYKKIRPYTIGAMRHTLNQRMIEIKRFVSDIEKLEKQIELKKLDTNRDSSALRYYKGRSGSRQVYWNALNAKDMVYVYTDWAAERYVGMKFYESYVHQVRSRTRKEKVLMNLTRDRLEFIRKNCYPGSLTAITSIEDMRVIDEKKMKINGHTQIYNNIYSQVYLNNVEIEGFEIQSNKLVLMQRALFEKMWESAEPISKYI